MIVKHPPVSNDKEAFDYIIDHLKRQDCKSMHPEGPDSGCQYRVEEYRNVLKCAVGALISVNEYDVDLEDNTVQSSGIVYDAVSNSNPDWVVDENSIEMLIALQRFHDELEVQHWSWMFDVVGEAIEQFGFDNIVYTRGYQRSALYLMVSLAARHILKGDNRLLEWNGSEVTLDWFSDKREKAMTIV
jgi:hypothetical protein